MGLACGSIKVDSVTDSSSDVVSFSFSERLPPGYMDLAFGWVPYVSSCFALLFLPSLSELCLLFGSSDFSIFLT